MKREEVEWAKIGMTVGECAKVLRVSERTVADLLAQGKLDSCAKLIGKEWRVSHEGLKLWLAQGGGRNRNKTEHKEEAEAETENQ